MIHQYEPKFDVADLNTRFVSYFQSGGFCTEYKKTEEFENKIKEFLGVKYCFVVNNGTISLSLALLALGIKPGAKVAVPDLTMIATPNAVRLIGAVPIFVDIEPDTLCMDISKLRELTDVDGIKAVIYVSLNGRCSNNISWLKHASIPVIDDAAQSFGSQLPFGVYCGTQSEIGSFSFSMPKIITTGQGGCLVTDDDDLATKIKHLKDFGRDKGGIDNHPYFGINSKFTELQALVGLSQIKDLEWRIQRKRDLYVLYRDNLKDVREVTVIETKLEYQVPWFIDILANDRDRLVAYLKDRGIGTRVIYPPIHTQESYNIQQDFPVTSSVCARGLWLPSSLTLSDNDIITICNAIKEFYNEH